MGWGIVIISFVGLFIAFVILQETLAQRHWRGLVYQGDKWAIQTLVEQEVEHWRGMRVPKGVNAAIWHGIQTAEVASVGRDFINLIASAEGEYRIVEGRRQEVSSPLDEGMKLAAALLERLFYDIPNVRLDLIRIDVYTTFRFDDGSPEQKCILSVTAERPAADKLPWDDLQPHEIVARFESKFRRGDHGVALPVDPGPSLRDDDPELEVETGVMPPPAIGTNLSGRDASVAG